MGRKKKGEGGKASVDGRTMSIALETISGQGPIYYIIKHVFFGNRQ